MKFPRRYSLALTQYCTGGCDYCVQEIERKNIKDTREQLERILSYVRIFISNIKKDFEKLNTCYSLSASLMGGELLDAPEWFQEKLGPLIQELSGYMTIYFFTNGQKLKNSVLHSYFKPLEDTGKLYYIIHLIHWDKHPYSYWLRTYSSFLKLSSFSFTLVIRHEEVMIFNDWVKRIVQTPQNVYTFANMAVSHKEIPTFFKDICSLLGHKTNVPLSTWDLPFALKKYLCRMSVQHGSGNICAIDVSCPYTTYICCGNTTKADTLKTYTEEERLNPLINCFISDMPKDYCSECNNALHFPAEFLYERNCMYEIPRLFEKIEMTNW